MSAVTNRQACSQNEQGLLVLAVDDELPGLDEIRFLLGRNRHVRRILGASDAVGALRILRGADPETSERLARGLPPVDVVFADITMPGLTGFELAQVINAFPTKPQLIFVTGFQEGALAAFDLGAVDYLIKIPDQHKVDRAIDRARSMIAATVATSEPALEEAMARDTEVIPIELGGTTRFVPRASVRYVEAQGDYARLHTAEGSHLMRIPLAQLEEQWEPVGFVRIHRSYLVYLPLISELRTGTSGYTFIIGSAPTEKELPVSRRHTRELKDRLVKQPKRGLSGNYG